MRRRSILFSFLVARFLSATAFAGPTSQPLYATDPGLLQVKVIRGVSLHDPGRNKDLLVTIFTPTSGGPFPVILFSHGAGGAPFAYEHTLNLWAGRGYVVIAPLHDDSLVLQHTRGPLRGMKVDLSGEMKQAVQTAVNDRDAWVNRTKDIKFILDSLPNLPASVPELNGRMDLAHIGMSGHSFGAMTTALLAGAVIDLSPEDQNRSFVDPRIKAALMLSGQGRGAMGFREHSWDPIQIPMMVMTGTKDVWAGGLGADWKLEPFKFSPAPEKFGVLVDGATHLSFCSGFSGFWKESGKDSATVLSAIEFPTLPFWDAYLKDDAQAKAYLHSNGLIDTLAGKATVWAK